MNYKDGGFVQMTEAAREDGSNVPHEKLSRKFIAEEPGYLYIYLSNEGELGSGEVFFDDFSITTSESYIVQAIDYYPHGMVASNWQREGEKATKDLFQGKTYEELTEWSDFHARQYDAALGRWFGVDPAGQFHSPFVGMGNNPVMMVDPDGEVAWFVPVIIGAVLNVGVNAAQGNIDNFWQGLGYAAIGGASGLAGYGAGQAVAGAVGTIGFAGGAMTGAAGGFAGGFVGGAGNAWAGGQSFADGLNVGLTSGSYGALSGGIIGGVSGGVQAVKHGGNFWSGKGATFDMAAIQGSYKGDPVEYNNKSAKAFSDDWFGTDIGGLDNLYADGSMPKDYTTKGGSVFNSKGIEVLGTTSYNGTGRGSDVFLYKNAFEASQKLYMVIGHEYIHVAHFNAGLFNGKLGEHAALTWSRDQARAFGILSYNKTWANDILNIKYYDKAYDYKKFIINPIFNFWPN